MAFTVGDEQATGARLVRVLNATDLPRPQLATEVVQATPTAPTTNIGRVYADARHLLLGSPLTEEQGEGQRLNKARALAVFSSDALSSTAYATEEILLILILGGALAFSYLMPIALAIVALLAIVIFSYRQTIHAYPGGGGAYLVSKDNLGRTPSLVAAAALLTDYVLTVAVSVSAGVAAITSAFAGLDRYRVELAVAAIILVAVLNLRGPRESGTIFAIPTYLFIVSMLGLIGVGLFSWITGTPEPTGLNEPYPAAAEHIGLFLILRAFSSGCTAMTGVEAISNGVPAFKEPAPVNAAQTLVIMGTILGTIFLGITALAWHFELNPGTDQTLISLMAHSFVGDSIFYYIIQAATAAILILAANTSFADYPRLSSILAQDGFLPRQLQFRGDRLAFSNGIILLGVVSAALVIVFKASLAALIPLYAVGVFLSFTLSQAGMTRHWHRRRNEPSRKRHMAINATGAVATGIVATIIVTTKFTSGAWLIIVFLPCFIAMMLLIERSYQRAADQLAVSTDDISADLQAWTHSSPVVVPIAALNRASLRAIGYAQAISSDVRVLRVIDHHAEVDAVEREWNASGMTQPLEIIYSPYRELVGPIVGYVEQVHQQHAGATVTVVVPEAVAATPQDNLLHNHVAWRLRVALWTHPNVVVTSVPYQLRR